MRYPNLVDSFISYLHLAVWCSDHSIHFHCQVPLLMQSRMHCFWTATSSATNEEFFERNKSHLLHDMERSHNWCRIGSYNMHWVGQQLHHPHKQMWQCGCPLNVLCSVELQSPSLQSMVQTGLSISIHDLFDIKYVGRAFKKNAALPLRVLMQFVSVTFCRQ